MKSFNLNSYTMLCVR